MSATAWTANGWRHTIRTSYGWKALALQLHHVGSFHLIAKAGTHIGARCSLCSLSCPGGVIYIASSSHLPSIALSALRVPPHNIMSISTLPSLVEGRLYMPELYMSELDARGYQFWNNLLFVCLGVGDTISN